MGSTGLEETSNHVDFERLVSIRNEVKKWGKKLLGMDHFKNR